MKKSGYCTFKEFILRNIRLSFWDVECLQLPVALIVSKDFRFDNPKRSTFFQCRLLVPCLQANTAFTHLASSIKSISTNADSENWLKSTRKTHMDFSGNGSNLNKKTPNQTCKTPKETNVMFSTADTQHKIFNWLIQVIKHKDKCSNYPKKWVILIWNLLSSKFSMYHVILVSTA